MPQMFAFDEDTRSAAKSTITQTTPVKTTLPVRQPAPRSWASLASGKSSPAPKAVTAPTGPTLQTQNFPALGVSSRPATPLKSDVLAAPVPRWGTAKGGLAQLLAGSAASSRVPSRAPSDAGDIAAERATGYDAVVAPVQKKKKKGKKGKGAPKGAGVSTQGLERPDFLLSKAVKKAVADQKLSRPTSSEAEAEEEDWKFLKKDVVPTPARSHSSSPPQSGLSSLLSQPHPADITHADSSATSEDECPTPVVAYEVPIEEDYVSRDVDSRPPSRVDKDPHRKMTTEDFEQLKYLGKGA